MGIYIVVLNGGRRLVVIADSASEAKTKITLKIQHSTQLEETPNLRDAQVGRLGDYSPGIEGARLMAGSHIIG